MIKVGLIGIGGMGRMHFNCYGNNPDAKVVAICDVDPKKLEGDWSSIGLNIDTSKSEKVDLTGIKTYADYNDLINDPDVDLVDITLPTPLHAPVTVAAFAAGKDVFCEKPMAFDLEGCQQMQEAKDASGKQLMIGHCLRYWTAYVKAKEIIDSGKYGKVLYARFHRISATPLWSWNNWLATGSQSGGCVLDMHIHDADTALWWFGEPQSIHADGVIIDDMPASVEATWRYDNGPVVHFHGAWDNNGGGFDFGFKVVLEKATLLHQMPNIESIQVLTVEDGEEKTAEIPLPDDLAYQNEIDDYVDCLKNDRKMERVTPENSRLSVQVVREELKQIEAKNK